MARPGKSKPLSKAERARDVSLAERLALVPFKERRKLLTWLERTGRLEEFVARWTFWARQGQRPPDGAWRTWLLMAGRGYGKTRAGAEWVHHLAEEEGLRIAIVGPTEEEARRVMVEGASGLLASAPDDSRPEWEPSRGALIWPSGSRAFVYSAANPESLRGPEHDHAWCDEIAKWPNGEAAWDNLTFGLRRGRWPRTLATTTPRPTPLLRRLTARADVVKTRGRTADNVMLAQSLIAHVTELYAGTRLGRQELDGELIEEIEGALWTRALIEKCRAQPPATLRRVLVGVDPPASAAGDACGIVVCGLGPSTSLGTGPSTSLGTGPSTSLGTGPSTSLGMAYVLADCSVSGLSPEGWARAVVAAAEAWEADRVIVETNQGGEMVEALLRGADCALPVKPVKARFGKGKRAEPVAQRFETGKAKFAGIFAELEDELCGLTVGGAYEGPGRSPDRADAMVWAMTELLLGEARQPRVRGL